MDTINKLPIHFKAAYSDSLERDEDYNLQFLVVKLGIMISCVT